MAEANLVLLLAPQLLNAEISIDPETGGIDTTRLPSSVVAVLRVMAAVYALLVALWLVRHCWECAHAGV